MNLFELEEKRDDAQADVKYYRREVERLEAKAGVKATDYSNKLTIGSSRYSKEDIYLQLTEMSMDLEDAIKKFDNINLLTNDKYNNFKKHNDYDRQIYIEKKLFKWSNAKICAKHGIGKSTIYRAIEEIEKQEHEEIEKNEKK